MKIFILTDLEGVSGIIGRSDGIGNKILNQAAAEQALVNEINACCEGLAEGGADDIVILDGHGSSSNIDIFNLHPKARLMQVGSWMPAVGLDAGYDAVIQLGAHSMQSTGAYLCHSYDSHSIARMEFNGRQIGEIGMSALQAAYFHVPTILVSGDEAACREAESFLGKDVVTVPTKFAMNRYAVVNRAPEALYDDLRRASSEALRRRDKIAYPEIPPRCELVIRMMCPNQADFYEKLGIERIDEVTLRFVSGDFIDLWAQHLGWAPGVHNRKYGMSPDWKFYP